MFDTHHHGPRSVSVHSTSHEHRAPTDESVRLLKEMEAAALAKLLSVTRLESNTLKATWHVFEDHPIDSAQAICRFELNGQEHKITVDLERARRHLQPEQLAYQIRDKVVEKLANILTAELFAEATSIDRMAIAGR